MGFEYSLKIDKKEKEKFLSNVQIFMELVRVLKGKWCVTQGRDLAWCTCLVVFLHVFYGGG